MKKRFNLVITGGGSSHTPGIVESIVKKREEFPLNKLVFYDIDKERLELVWTVCKQQLEPYEDELEVVITTNPEEAYKGADFVFAQVRCGGLKMREKDEKIPLKYDVVGQETCGPGGFAYGLRSIKAVSEIIDDVRKYAKDAWIVNYSNPSAIVAEATRRMYNNEKILNICDMPVAIQMSFAKMLGLESYDDLEPIYFGLNHFGWWTKLYDKQGNDKLPELRELILEKGLASSHDKHHSDPDWRKTWDNFKEILSDFPDFLPNTYLQYYLYGPEVVKKTDKSYTRANMVMDGREKHMFEEAKAVVESNGQHKVNLGLFNAFGDFMVDVAASIAYNLGRRYLVIVENRGTIANLPYDAMVEVPAYIRSWGPEAVNIGNIPTFYKGLIENQLAYEKLAVDAYYEQSYQKALQSLTLNKMVPGAKVARKILDDLIEANKDYWPELK